MNKYRLMTKYDAVFQWNMSPLEADAYKLAVTWEELVSKYFPRQKTAKLPLRSDPRKSTLFKYCWKLARETRGLLKVAEYQLYIQANLQIIQANNGRAEPNCLVGDKAWYRWLVWKRLYEKKLRELKGEESPPEISIDPEVTRQLDGTRRFLFEKFEGEPTDEKFAQTLEDGRLDLWVKGGRVSKYYLVLSPRAARVCGLKELGEKLHFDVRLAQENITPGVQLFFNKEFADEFVKSDGIL
jgi:hypothetical protein